MSESRRDGRRRGWKIVPRRRLQRRRVGARGKRWAGKRWAGQPPTRLIVLVWRRGIVLRRRSQRRQGGRAGRPAVQLAGASNAACDGDASGRDDRWRGREGEVGDQAEWCPEVGTRRTVGRPSTRSRRDLRRAPRWREVWRPGGRRDPNTRRQCRASARAQLPHLAPRGPFASALPTSARADRRGCPPLRRHAPALARCRAQRACATRSGGSPSRATGQPARPPPRR